MSGTENLPPLKTAAAMDLDEIRPYLLDPREEYPEPFFLLEFNGIPFSPLGGIQAITGQKKNGKFEGEVYKFSIFTPTQLITDGTLGLEDAVCYNLKIPF